MCFGSERITPYFLLVGPHPDTVTLLTVITVTISWLALKRKRRNAHTKETTEARILSHKSVRVTTGLGYQSIVKNDLLFIKTAFAS